MGARMLARTLRCTLAHTPCLSLPLPPSQLAPRFSCLSFADHDGWPSVAARWSASLA